MKNLTIISVLLLFLGIGCTQPIGLQKCDVEMNVLFDNGIERLINQTVELTACDIQTANHYIFLSSVGSIRYTKPNHIGSNILLNNVNYFTIESIKPTLK